MDQMLWNLIAATRGGTNRGRIIQKLRRGKPLNAHQLSRMLSLDYKTTRHHIAVLAECGIVMRSVGERREEVYSLTTLMRDNLDAFDRIWARVGEQEDQWKINLGQRRSSSR